MKENSRQFILALAIFEVIFIILFGFFVRYDEDWTDEQLNRNRFSCIQTNDSYWSSLKSRVQGNSKRLYVHLNFKS